MKRKPLKYMEQHRLVRFHTHQKRYGEMIGKRRYVSLPDPAPVSDTTGTMGDAAAQLETPTVATSKLPSAQMSAQGPDTAQRTPGGQSGPAPMAPTAVARPQQAVGPMPPMNMGLPRPVMVRPQHPPQQMWPRGSVAPNEQQNRMQMILKKIQKDQMEHDSQKRIGSYTGHAMPRPSYGMMGQMQQRMPAQMAYAPMTAIQQQQQQQKARQMQMMQMMTPEQRQTVIIRMRMRQQQQAVAMGQGMMGGPQYGAQYSQPVGHPHVPMPPMPVQQPPMQHGYGQQMMVRQPFPPPQQPGAPMNPMQRPMY